MYDIILGKHLTNNSLKNLQWWINSSHSKKLPRESYKLIVKIMNDFATGLENFYDYKHPALLQHLDLYLNDLKKEDPMAQAIDFRVIFNLPEGQIVNEGYVIKAAPYNISYNG